MSWEEIIIEPSEIAVQTEEMTNALEQNGAPIDSAASAMSWTQALDGAWEERKVKQLNGGNGSVSGIDGRAMPHLTAGIFRVMEEYETTGKPTRSFQDLMARGGIQSLGSWKEFVESRDMKEQEIHENKENNLKGYEAYRNALGEMESSNNYEVINQYGYMGRYQFGLIALQEIGFNDSAGNWTDLANEYGVFSNEDFLKNHKAQDIAFDLLVKKQLHYIYAYQLDEYIGQTMNEILITESGLVAACHLVGIGGVKSALEKGDLTSSCDGNQVSAKYYMERFGGYNLNERE